jgi:hypothetical protein
LKDINAVGDRMTRNGRKMSIAKSCIFFNQTDFNINPNPVTGFFIMPILWDENSIFSFDI